MLIYVLRWYLMIQSREFIFLIYYGVLIYFQFFNIIFWTLGIECRRSEIKSLCFRNKPLGCFCNPKLLWNSLRSQFNLKPLYLVKIHIVEVLQFFLLSLQALKLYQLCHFSIVEQLVLPQLLASLEPLLTIFYFFYFDILDPLICLDKDVSTLKRVPLAK